MDNRFLGSIEQVPLREVGKYQMNVTLGTLREPHTPIPESEVREDLKNRVFMASTIKVPYIAAFCKLMPDLELDSKLPLSTIVDIAQEEDLKDLSETIFAFITRGEETDPLYVRLLVPHILTKLEDGQNVNEITLEQISHIITEVFSGDFGISLRDLLAITAGPSSNTSLFFLKSYLAQSKFNGDMGQASDALENILNDLLSAQGYQRDIRLTGSAQSKEKGLNNTGATYELEELFNIFFDNGFEIPEETQVVIRSAMQEVAPETHAFKLNRLHEIKTIAGRIFNPRRAIVEEKSGYIGLNAAKKGEDGFNSGIERDYKWDDIALNEGESLVVLNLSSVARVYLQNGAYLQIAYSIAQPVVITKENEEEDENYLAVKAQLNSGIEAEVSKILQQYESEILFAAQ